MPECALSGCAVALFVLLLTMDRARGDERALVYAIMCSAFRGHMMACVTRVLCWTLCQPLCASNCSDCVFALVVYVLDSVSCLQMLVPILLSIFLYAKADVVIRLLLPFLLSNFVYPRFRARCCSVFHHLHLYSPDRCAVIATFLLSQWHLLVPLLLRDEDQNNMDALEEAMREDWLTAQSSESQDVADDAEEFFNSLDPNSWVE